jgi:hypothetical protein
MTQLGFKKKQLYFLDASSRQYFTKKCTKWSIKYKLWMLKKKKLTCTLYILGILQNMGRCAN